MSRNINVNPGQYKTAGRERQGEDVVHKLEKQKIKSQARGAKRTRVRRTSPAPARSTVTQRRSPGPAGISNRLRPAAEAKDRSRHPPVDTASPPPEDAAGRVGEQPLDDRRDRHTSHKAGSRSIAQKQANARYPDRSMPASRKVAGAFGREPKEGRRR
jgi:hypothetical protein